MSNPNWLRYVLVAWCLLSLGCGPKAAIPGLTLAVPPTETTLPIISPGTGSGSAVTLNGRVTFEKVRFVDANGNSTARTIVVSPLRFVDVQAVNAAGTAVSATVSTNDNGQFSLVVPAATPVFPTVLFSTTASAGRFNAEVRDLTDPGQVLGIRYTTSADGAPLPGFAAGQTVALTLPTFPAQSVNTDTTGLAEGTGPSNILDAAFRASEAVRNAQSNASLPLVTFRYDPASTIGSFFTFLGANETLPNIFIKGGNSDSDDTDEFDDSVIQHEYGHFMVSQLSKDPSIGGEHALSDTEYPQLSYSEGVANWFSGIAGNIPVYVDTAGATGGSTLGFRYNFETRGTQFSTRGRTSEGSVSEILWDLTDGAETRASTDNDAASISFKSVLDGLKALRGSIVLLVIDDLLQQLISQGSVSSSTVNTLLSVPEDQQITLLLPDTLPVSVTRPGVALDSCFTVAANFGINSGLDATNRFFKLDLPGATSNVSIGMFLLNGVAGTDASGTNINMFLLDAQVNRIAGPAATSQTAYENLQVNNLPAGRYYIYVTGRPDPFSGNATNATGVSVDYRLEVQ